jgi:acyl-CoA thioester hydrolase
VAVPYRHLVEVRPADIDELGHASNLVYLRWVLEAALAHSTSRGLDQAAYLSRRETRVASMAAANSIRRTRIVRASDGAELCRATTDWAFLDLDRGRPRRIPPDIRSRFPIEPD